MARAWVRVGLLNGESRWDDLSVWSVIMERMWTGRRTAVRVAVGVAIYLSLAALTFVALDFLGVIPHRDRPPCVTDEAYVRDTEAVADFLFEESRADRLRVKGAAAHSCDSNDGTYAWAPLESGGAHQVRGWLAERGCDGSPVCDTTIGGVEVRAKVRDGRLVAWPIKDSER